MLVVRSPNAPARDRDHGTFKKQRQLKIHFCVSTSVVSSEKTGSASFPKMTDFSPYCYCFNMICFPILCCFLHPLQRILPLHRMSTQTVFSVSEWVEISTEVVENAADRREMALSGPDPPATCSCCSASTEKFPSSYLC